MISKVPFFLLSLFVTFSCRPLPTSVHVDEPLVQANSYAALEWDTALKDLENKLQKKSNPTDTLLRASLLDTLISIQLRSGSLGEAFTGIEKLTNLLQGIDSTSYLYAKTYNHLSYYYLTIDDTTASTKYCRKALMRNLSRDLTDSISLLQSVYLSSYNHYKAGKTPIAEKMLQGCLSFVEKEPKIPSFIIIEYYNLLGTIELQKRNYALAAQYFKKSILYFEKQNNPSFFLGIEAYSNLGYTYHLQDKLIKADSTYAFFQQKYQLGPYHTGIIVGDFFYYRGMLELAKNNFSKTLDYYSLAEKIYSSDNNKVIDGYEKILLTKKAKLYHNAALQFELNGKYLEADSVMNKAFILYRQLFKYPHPTLAKGFYNWASIVKGLKQWDRAIDYIDSSLAQYQLLSPNNLPLQLVPYLYMGEVYSETHDYQKAAMYYSKALSSLPTYDKMKDYRLGIVYKSIASLEYEKGDLEEALLNCKHSLHNFNVQVDNLNLPKRIQLRNVNTPLFLFETLILRARILNKQSFEKNDTLSFRRSLDTYMLAQQLIDTMRVNVEAEGDKLIVLEKTYKLYEPAISLAYQLYRHTGQKKYIHKAFYLAEKSKANILLEAVHNREALQFAGIEKNVQLLELQWKEELNYLRRRLRELGNVNETDKVRRGLVDRQFFLQKRYDSLMLDFALHHPSYYRFKNDFNVVDIPTLQQSLKADQAIVEYAYGDSSLYAWIIKANGDTMIHIPKKAGLETQIADYIRSISARARPELADSLAFYDAIYAKSAFNLYQQLIIPLGNLPYRVTLIPDGVLSRIAFDALLSQQVNHEDYLAYPYFLNEHALSSCFSATMLREMQEKKVNPERKKVLALALSFPRPDAKVQGGEQQKFYWNRLEASYQKTKRINKLIEASTLLENEASIDNFKVKAPKYSVLLFSTHCVLDIGSGENSFLALADTSYPSTISPLYPADLYNIRLNAELVILSACLTAGGKHQKGEGILSLARGFSYAGAKSILATLWEVNDGANAIFLDYFYKEIQNDNQSKDVALQLSRKKYLKNIPDTEKAHPYYWAAATAIGDMQPIEQGGRLLSYRYLWVLCCIALPMLVLWAIKSRLSYPNPQRVL